LEHKSENEISEFENVDWEEETSIPSEFEFFFESCDKSFKIQKFKKNINILVTGKKESFFFYFF
jgi:hypothetical protein